MQFLLEQCNIALEQHDSIFLTLFFAGLVGGLTHCAGMCAPFVMAQIKHCDDAEGTTGSINRLSKAALLPYHFGRMSTYMLLGSISALLSRQIIGTPVQRWASVLLLTIAGIIFILSALPPSKRLILSLRSVYLSRIGCMIGELSRPLIEKTGKIHSYALGVLLGFLPCGLVFAALMVVSTTADPVGAAFAMAVFTLGTFPALFLVGIGSQFAYKKWPHNMQVLARGVMVFNGFSLFVLAGSMVL